jgi:O-acetyl-ADP-ribose deacetylase
MSNRKSGDGCINIITEYQLSVDLGKFLCHTVFSYRLYDGFSSSIFKNAAVPLQLIISIKQKEAVKVMIRAVNGDITKLEEVQYICNAANGIGPMGGGVAAAIRRAGGKEIETEAIKVCKEQNPMPGELYVTNAGTLPYKKVIHLVTMKEPAGETSYDIVKTCLEHLVSYCQEHGIQKVALPALGTGVGKLDKTKVADIFKEVLGPVKDIEFIVVDIDQEFVQSF